tara:strand:- start:1086 stop:1679 length:594 start_codon:yes stop_codon:yes gene_type:complete
MSKKLLSEAVVRRFATLANLPSITEMRSSGYGMNEDADEEIADDAAEAGMGELPAGDEAELEMDAGEDFEMDAGESVEADAGLGEREALAMDVISAVADALNIEVDIEGGESAEAEMDVGAPEEMDAAEDDMAAADDLDDDAYAEEEEAIMEALRGINYIPGKKAIVNEVAKRVARRLLKAKRADKELKEALGSRKS